jgi:hypothetical protein
MSATVRAISVVAVSVVLSGCGALGAHSAVPGVATQALQRGVSANAVLTGPNADCRIVVEGASASGSPPALGNFPCDPSDGGVAAAIAVNTVGGYDVLFTDMVTNKSVVRRFGSDGASTSSTLILDFIAASLATHNTGDRGHDFLDRTGGRIVKYTSTTTDPTMRASDVKVPGDPQFAQIATSPAADATVYVVAGPPGSQSIDALTPNSATVSRAIGPIANNAVGGIAVDSQGSLYVAVNFGNNESAIRVYANTASGTAMPIRKIVPSAPGRITALAISPDNGTLYAAHAENVMAFALDASGPTAASRTITPHPNETQSIVGLAVSADGSLGILENVNPVLSCAQNSISGPGVPLGSAATFAVLASSTVTNAGATVVTGDLGVSPGTAITGFGPGMVSDGAIHANDPTAQQAQAALGVAYGNAAGRTNPAAVPADIGGTTIAPGVYLAPTSLAITGNVTLDGRGNPNSVFIFQIPSTLTTAVNSSVTLINGQNACNVFWQVGSSATLNTATAFSGTIMASGSVSLGTGATVSGRAMAENGAVTMLSNTVTVTGP